MPFPHIASPPELFPTYLVPSLSFRRRKSSADSTDSANSTDTAASSTTSQTYLAGHASHLRCSRCLADLALSEQIVSKGFTGRHGRAYLVSPTVSALPTSNPLISGSPKVRNDALPNLPNTYTHKPAPRQLVTGSHIVSDMSCAQCGSVLGWKYVAAEDDSQKYKVGKFILETKRVTRSSCWEEDDGAAAARVVGSGSVRWAEAGISEQDVQFDSQDEDECEDLFMGIWTPQLAAKRRRTKQG